MGLRNICCEHGASLVYAGLHRWWDCWKRYSSYDAVDEDDTPAVDSTSASESSAPAPGPITNEPLLLKGVTAEERELKDNLLEGVHFTIVSRASWDLLSDK